MGLLAVGIGDEEPQPAILKHELAAVEFPVLRFQRERAVGRPRPEHEKALAVLVTGKPQQSATVGAIGVADTAAVLVDALDLATLLG